MTKKLFYNLPDNGYPLSRLITTMMSGLIVWELSNMGVAANTDLGLFLATLIIVFLNVGIILKQGLNSIRISRVTLKIIVIEEYLFFVGLFGISYLRGFLPNIDSLEKFMDFGFVNRYLLSPTLPAADMWQAGKSINYYSFGHYWASIVIRYFGVDPAVGYNLVLAFIAGLSLSISFSISYFLSGTKKYMSGMVGGLTGAFATVMAGNTHVIWYFISNKGLMGYWYADATRFIHNTIHEFPSYSFVVADLHGHLIDLPVVLAFVLIFLHWIHSRKIWDEIILGIIFGVMMMTNTWDMAVYGLFMIIAGIIMTLRDYKEFLKLLKSAGVMLVFMMLTALPWFITFQSISDGIKMVTERTPLWQLAVLWTGGMVVSVLAVLTEKKGDKSLPIWTLVICILLLIIIPEIVYAKDIYPDHPRANTMFKLTYQSSIMIGLLVGAVFGKLFDSGRKLFFPYRAVSILVILTIFIGTMTFPVVAFPNFYGNFNKYYGLNGEKWLEVSMPERYDAITYLRKNNNGKNMVEAVGDSYSNFNAVSVFSGVPTIQGWRVHEWLWRGGYEVVANREAEVREIYEGFNIETTTETLKKYNIGWIIVGEDENSTYQVNDEIILSLGEKVFEEGGTYLIKVR